MYTRMSGDVREFRHDDGILRETGSERSEGEVDEGSRHGRRRKARVRIQASQDDAVSVLFGNFGEGVRGVFRMQEEAGERTGEMSELSGKLWLLGLEMQKKEQERKAERLKERMRERHMLIMKSRKKFMGMFNVDVRKFYKDVIFGFDTIAFDDWLRSNVEAYDEDKESMSEFIIRKFGKEAEEMVRSFI